MIEEGARGPSMGNGDLNWIAILTRLDESDNVTEGNSESSAEENA